MAKSKIELTFGEAMEFLLKGMDLKVDAEVVLTANYAHGILSGVTIEFETPTTKKGK